MLDALGLEHLVHHVRTRVERRVHVAARVRRAREHVAVELPHGVFGIVERGDRIGDRPQHDVFDFDQRRGRARAVSRSPATTNASTSPRYDVRPPSGMNTGQSLWIRPDPQLPGHVGRGEHAHDARHRPRPPRVDAHHVGAGVIRERGPRRATSRRVGGRRRTTCRRARDRIPGSGCRSNPRRRAGALPRLPFASRSTASRIFT